MKREIQKHMKALDEAQTDAAIRSELAELLRLWRRIKSKLLIFRSGGIS